MNMKIMYEDLYRDYHGKVLTYISGKVQNRDLAEDLCQDVFVKALENADSFDADKASVSTWLFTITRNTLIDYFRTRKVTEELPETLTDSESIEDGLVSAELLEQLTEALSRMDERMRDVIILRYYSGKSLREIADGMGISYAYVKVIQNKALNFLKNFLENQ